VTHTEHVHLLFGIGLTLAGLGWLGDQARPGTPLRYAWPLLVFLVGLFLVIPTETQERTYLQVGLWDTFLSVFPNSLSVWLATVQQPHVIQHKTAGVCAMLAGGIEVGRAGGWLAAPRWRWAMPALAIGAGLAVGVHGGSHQHLPRVVEQFHHWILGGALVLGGVVHGWALAPGGWRLGRFVLPSLVLLAGLDLALFYRLRDSSPGVAAPPADLLLRGGAVYTVDAARSWASAVAVRQGRIVYVGGDSVPPGLIGPRTAVMDLAGKMVLPGFQDGHVHLVAGGVELGECALFGLARAAIADSVGACAAARPSAPWVRGSGWELPAFPDGNPSKALLDSLVPDRPAYFEAADGHSAWANSQALALAGVTRQTPDPANGRIERDPRTGEPSGTLRESATSLVSALLPERSDAELTEGLARAQRRANAAGITSAFEAWASESHLRALAAADRAGTLTLRIVAAADGEPDSTGIDSLVRRLGRWRSRYSTRLVRPAAVKLFQDGVIESRTAALLAPYLDGKGSAGTPIYPQATLDSLTEALDRARWQVHVHAIGDRAIRMTLDALAHARKANGARAARHTITHLQLVDPADMPRFRELGVIANFEPFWANGDEYLTRLAEPALGPKRSRWLYPIGSLVKAGAVVSGGSDWSVSSIAPLDGIQVAITHRDTSAPSGAPPWRPEEAVDLAAAIAMYTINAAYQLGHEGETGSIEVGKLADLVVLERNLFGVAPAEIHRVRVLRTILEGTTVYQR
jgi:predicted amidohydrolase YtcJ